MLVVVVADELLVLVVDEVMDVVVDWVVDVVGDLVVDLVLEDVVELALSPITSGEPLSAATGMLPQTLPALSVIPVAAVHEPDE